jgi:hypothetical protein
MVASRLTTAFTEREYLALEAVAEVRHEFVDGDSWTMRVLSLTAPLVLKDGTSVELGDLYRLTSTG